MIELKNLIDEQFHKDNFIIRTNKVYNNSSDKYAVVYCSSNGVYRQDTVEDFQESIVEKDNYEWFMTRVPFAEKHIFIRDVTRRFYQFGINDKEINSLEKLVEMIKSETAGYKIITIGSSSGGMAAIVLGKMLNVDYTIAFSPMLRNYKESVSKQEINEKLQTKEFIEFVSFANSDIPIFYVFPSGSEWDIYNSNLVKDFKNVYFLPIKSSVHGVPINKRVLSKFLSCNKEDLKKYCKYKNTDIISEYKFVKDNWGIKFYFLRIWDYIKKYPFFIFRKDFYNNIFSCF